jgi:hypothetical protein
MGTEDDVDPPHSIDLDSDVDMERDGEDDEEEDEEEEDEEKEDEEEDKDEDDGKEPRTISQREMVNTSAENAYTMVDNEPTVLPEKGHEMEQGQEMRELTPRPKPPPAFPTATNPGASPTTTNSGDSYTQWA